MTHARSRCERIDFVLTRDDNPSPAVLIGMVSDSFNSQEGSQGLHVGVLRAEATDHFLQPFDGDLAELWRVAMRQFFPEDRFEESSIKDAREYGFFDSRPFERSSEGGKREGSILKKREDAFDCWTSEYSTHTSANHFEEEGMKDVTHRVARSLGERGVKFPSLSTAEPKTPPRRRY